MLAFHKYFSKGLALFSQCHSILTRMQSYIAQGALDDRYTNKFALLNSMAIYPKPGHQLLYTSITGEMKIP